MYADRNVMYWPWQFVIPSVLTSYVEICVLPVAEHRKIVYIKLEVKVVICIANTHYLVLYLFPEEVRSDHMTIVKCN